MRPMSICVGVFFALLCAGNLLAQDNYDRALGLRGGNPSGITYKTFLDRYTGYEVIAGVNFSYEHPTPAATGIFQYNWPLGTYTNLYGGAGMTMGVGEKFIWHLDAMVGVEYLISNFPVLLSLDYKPAYSLLDRQVGARGWLLSEYGLSARYIF
jgi:hypothetical protein